MKEVYTYMSEKFDCFAKSCANPSTIYNKISSLYKSVSSLSRARDADKKKHLLSRKFSVPQKMSNEEKALLSSKTEKEKRLKLELHQTKKENRSLKRTLTDIEQEEQKLPDELEHIHSIYNGIIRNMQDTSVKLEQYTCAKESEAQYLSKEMQKLQEMFDKQSKQLDLTTEQYAECKKKLSSAKIKNIGEIHYHEGKQKNGVNRLNSVQKATNLKKKIKSTVTVKTATDQ